MAYAQVKRLSREEAIDEIRQALARVPANERQEALDEAASTYVGPGHWHADALDVLVAAGADRDQAQRVRESRPTTRGLGGLGEQGSLYRHVVADDILPS